jgi:large subunit ribosomal protein L21
LFDPETERVAVYAVVRIAGRPILVQDAERVRVPHLAASAGSEIEFTEVLAVGDGPEGEARFGRPLLAGARVVAEVLRHAREPKILVFHKKRRKDHRKKNGHQQPCSEIRVKAIHAG